MKLFLWHQAFYCFVKSIPIMIYDEHSRKWKYALIILPLNMKTAHTTTINEAAISIQQTWTHADSLAMSTERAPKQWPLIGNHEHLDTNATSCYIPHNTSKYTSRQVNETSCWIRLLFIILPKTVVILKHWKRSIFLLGCSETVEVTLLGDYKIPFSTRKTIFLPY